MAFLPVRQHNFWGSVPSCGHILGQVISIFVRVRVETSCKPEVANFEFTICIDEQIPWFQVAMNYASGMNVLHACAHVR